MRTLSDDEKQVVQLLIEGRSFISDVFNFDDYEGYLIDFDFDPYTGTKEVVVIVKSTIEMNEAVRRFEDLQISLARTINIVNYLLSKNFLFLIQPSHAKTGKGQIGAQSELTRFNADPNAYNIKIPLPESYLKPALIALLDQRIITTKALEEYFENDFQTKEEIHNRRTYLVSIWALIIAIVIGIASIMIGIFGTESFF